MQSTNTTMAPCCANQKPSGKPVNGRRNWLSQSASSTPQPSETAAQIASSTVMMRRLLRQ